MLILILYLSNITAPRTIIVVVIYTFTCFFHLPAGPLVAFEKIAQKSHPRYTYGVDSLAFQFSFILKEVLNTAGIGNDGGPETIE